MSRMVSVAAPMVAAVALAACAGDDESRSATGPVTTADPVRAFAPHVQLDGRERWLPTSASYFLSNSGLEWAGGYCLERDVTASGTLPPGAPSPLARLDPSRLGGRSGRAYTARASTADCSELGRRTYSSAQLTRPFDRVGRPPGLRVDEGFNLDVAAAAQPGPRRPAGGRLTGVPAYYGRVAAGANGDGGLRIHYWMLFGREDRRAPEAPSIREGDWERIDVLLRRGRRPNVYRPRAIEYWNGDRPSRVEWEDTELTGVPPTHPVIRLVRGSHAPRPGGECDGCIDWSTWRSLRDVRAQPWWGYGGGWGSIGGSSATSGPSGPSPRNLVSPR